MHHYLAAMRRYAVFQGRASRAEFWQFTLVFILGSFALSLVSQILFGIEGDGSQVLAGLWTIAHLLPALAVTVRRLHDTDRTGWWVLINLTGIGSIIGFIFALLPGTDGPNRFGLPGNEADRNPQDQGPGRYNTNSAPASHTPTRWDVEPTLGRPDEARFDDGARAPGPVVHQPHQPPAASTRSIDVIGDLERLSQLRAAGGLSEAEFAALKAQTLTNAGAGTVAVTADATGTSRPNGGAL